VQPSNVVPTVIDSLRSTSMNTQSANFTAPSTWPYQSSFWNVSPSAPDSRKLLTRTSRGRR
jgi:hypothetical protein